MRSSGFTVLIVLLVTSTTSSAVPLHYFDLPEVETTTADHDLSFQGRQAQTPPIMNITAPSNVNSTTSSAPTSTSRPPTASPTATNTTVPANATSPTATSPTTTVTTTRAPAAAATTPTTNATTTVTTTAKTTQAPTTTRPRPVVGNCTLGDDILHILFNRTTVESGMFTLEHSVGVVGSREEILNALMMRLGNHSRQDIEACLDLYRIPPEPAVGTPDPSGSSHLAYQRPGHLGGQPVLPVPQPASDNFVYGHGYTTYQRPFSIGQRVPLYSPHPVLRANSLQDLFRVLARDFLEGFNLLWEHGSPAFWFDRNAAPRRPRSLPGPPQLNT